MEERKSMGGALVDVFDAGLTLVKAEINNVGRKAGEMAKAKGVGAVLLLAAVGPLIMGLIFLILMLFYGLMALGLPAWASALIIALLSFVLTGALVLLGIKKLGAEVDTREPLMRRDELDWESREADLGGVQAAPAVAAAAPVSTATYAAATPRTGDRVTYTVTSGTAYQGEMGGATGTAAASADTATQRAAAPNADTVTSKTEPHAHGGHGHDDDPNIRRIVVLDDQPGIRVSTDPTFREDMSKEGY